MAIVATGELLQPTVGAGRPGLIDPGSGGFESRGRHGRGGVIGFMVDITIV